MDRQKWMGCGFVFLLCIAGIPIVFPDDMAGTPRLEPQAFVKELASSEEVLTDREIVTAALVFSGAASESLTVYIDMIDALCSDYEILGREYKSEKESAENALLYLHKHILDSYDEYQTSVDVVLESGRYNCVSSAVLYMILLGRLSIEVWGVKTTDHAFCRVRADGVEYDVETTTAFGFEPGKKKEFVDAFGNATGYSYVPPSNYSRRQNISRLELLTLILQNRITAYTNKDMFGEAVGLGVDIYTLLKDDFSFDNMVKTFYNIAAFYDNERRYEEGCLFFDRAIDIYGDDEKITRLRLQLANNYVIHMLTAYRFDDAETFISRRYEAGRLGEAEKTEFSVIIALKKSEYTAKGSYEDALRIIDSAIMMYGPDKRLLETKGGLINNWIVGLLEKKEVDAAEILLETLKRRGDVDEATWKKFMVIVYQERAATIAERDGYLPAAFYLEKAMEIVGNDRVLRKNHEVYLYNYSVDIHNEVIELWNAGDYEGAKALLESALKAVPSSTILQGDLDKVKKLLGQGQRGK
ncbi:MAG: hypothetical protein JW881_21360 [Spirochaetales bacterium]|nr:hypothetical protein [Spirochaetales bacterium]